MAWARAQGLREGLELPSGPLSISPRAREHTCTVLSLTCCRNCLGLDFYVFIGNKMAHDAVPRTSQNVRSISHLRTQTLGCARVVHFQNAGAQMWESHVPDHT